ncbi:MAG: type III-B CRISPR-associated protein Cas10/Cmr2, partial [Planctomycetota bacterium]
PAYFGALLLDGDHMGKWLQGRNTPRVREIMHPDLVRYFEGLSDPAGSVRAALDARRHTGPTIHAAISEALGTFSLHVVPRVVEDSRGELIYAGGDDVLALLPVETALGCALRLYRGFRGELGPADDWPEAPEGFVRLAEEEPERLAMGPLATASCGIAIVHYKDDLRAALAAARRAEKAAKEGGRDRLGLIARRRSGEHSLSVVPWRMLPLLDALVRLYAREDAPTDRWAYKLRAAADGLGGLPVEAITLEIERLIARTEEDNQLRPTLLGLARELWTLHAASHPEAADGATTRELVESFAILIQTASFMARGRDDR